MVDVGRAQAYGAGARSQAVGTAAVGLTPRTSNDGTATVFGFIPVNGLPIIN